MARIVYKTYLGHNRPLLVLAAAAAGVAMGAGMSHSVISHTHTLCLTDPLSVRLSESKSNTPNGVRFYEFR